MRVLLLDVETAPNLVHVWGLWNQNVSLNQIQASGYVLCWAAKWYGKSEVLFDSVHQSKPAAMLKRIYGLIDEADTVVHYNGTSFDMPTLNKEFILQGLNPPAPYKQCDLYLTAKKRFRFPSNKLEYIARTLGLGHKTKHEGHELWVKCMAGDSKAWTRMERYNRNDVSLLERVYDKMKPWIQNHPNYGAFSDSEQSVCTNCGSTKLQRRGYARTQVYLYARFQCTDCGTWMRGHMGQIDARKRGKLMRPIL